MAAIVMTYGRFNPPTIGHELLIDKMKRILVPYVATDHYVYLSPTSTGRDNPLTFSYRHWLMTKAFGTQVIVSEIEHKDIFAAIRWAYDIGYADLYLIVGGDRHEELAKRVPKYNGTEYKFRSINVLNAGDRDKYSDGVDGMSSSFMRDAAELGDYEFFESGLPRKLRSMSKDICDRVREACHLNSSLQKISSS